MDIRHNLLCIALKMSTHKLTVERYARSTKTVATTEEVVAVAPEDASEAMHGNIESTETTGEEHKKVYAVEPNRFQNLLWKRKHNEILHAICEDFVKNGCEIEAFQD